MVTRVLDQEIIGYLNYFDKVIHVQAKDCFIFEDFVVFIVPEGQGRKAVGPNGSKAKNLSERMHKRVRIIEFSEDIEQFIKNLTYPAKISKLYKAKDNLIDIQAEDYKSRGMMIGKNKKNLDALHEILRRFFGDITIKVE
ncbi:NusA-like transcription termination signal-binding factor [Candidatus Woesearchaeota archaeon]|nr:NusA-like transcription termination signal-binding factor [Candidatus Woesearchaeota archaeon]